LAQERVDAGELSASEAARSADAKRLTAAIGGGLFGVAPDVFTVDIQPADVVLLCTDGLTEDVSDDTVRDILDAGWPADEACRRLVEVAKNTGGRDNITCVVTRFEPMVGPRLRGSKSRAVRSRTSEVNR
jgi:protein phosphatase